MPIYIFKNPITGKIKEVIQKMNDEHVYFENGVYWERVFTVPQSSIDTKIDAFSETDFKNKTANKGGTLGDLMDRSKELSEKRASIEGRDPVQQKFFDDYSKKRNGKKHLKDPSREVNYNKNLFSLE